MGAGAQQDSKMRLPPLFVYLFIGFIGPKSLHNYAVEMLRIPAFFKHTLNKNSWLKI
jgi:hypothetical protein